MWGDESNVDTTSFKGVVFCFVLLLSCAGCASEERLVATAGRVSVHWLEQPGCGMFVVFGIVRFQNRTAHDETYTIEEL